MMTIKPISIHPITMKIKRIKEKLDGLQDEDRDRVVQALDIVQDIVLSKYNEE